MVDPCLLLQILFQQVEYTEASKVLCEVTFTSACVFVKAETRNIMFEATLSVLR